MTWTIEMLEQGKRLYAEGKSSGEIAKLFGLTRNQVVGVVHRRGWKGGISRSEAGRRGATAAHGIKTRPARKQSVIRPKRRPDATSSSAQPRGKPRARTAVGIAISPAASAHRASGGRRRYELR